MYIFFNATRRSSSSLLQILVSTVFCYSSIKSLFHCQRIFVDCVNWRTTGDLHLFNVLYPDGENLPRTTGDSRT